MRGLAAIPLAVDLVPRLPPRPLTAFLGLIACAGLAGCFVPSGGWTLRSGFDCRTHRKPACFLELVDTRWDEWNRVAQINAMQGTGPAPWTPAPPGVPPASPPPQPVTVPAPAGTEPAQLPPVPEPQPSPKTAALPAGAWLFRK